MPTVTSLPSLLPQMSLFTPPLNHPTESFTEQLQSTISEMSLLSMELSSTSPTFSFNPVNCGGSQLIESGGAIHELNMDQFIVGAENHGEEMGMDTDDPILNSLQILAEGRDFGENLGNIQNFNMWEWFE
jgi:hypothetical protein